MTRPLEKISNAKIIGFQAWKSGNIISKHDQTLKQHG